MNFAPLFSGSSGNAVYVGSQNTHLLVDAGLSGARIARELERVGLRADALSGILITHEHTDHIAGVGVMSRRFDLPVYATEGTWREMHGRLGKIAAQNVRVLDGKRPFRVGDIEVNPFPLSHDAADPVGYALFLGAPVLLYAARRQDGLDTLRMLPLPLSRALLIALLAASALMLVSLVSMWFLALVEATGGTAYDTALPMPKSRAGIIGMVLQVAVLPGIFEELLFRGALLRAWEKRGGTYAVVVTTLLFAALHNTVLGLPSQLISGAIMALLVIRLNSVYASMVFHTVYNGLNYGLALYANSAVDAAEAAALESATTVELLGGAGGLLALVPSMLLFALITYFLYRMCVRWSQPVLLRDSRPEPMDWKSLVVLISALITCAAYYALDVAAIWFVP